MKTYTVHDTHDRRIAFRVTAESKGDAMAAAYEKLPQLFCGWLAAREELCPSIPADAELAIDLAFYRVRRQGA